MALSFITHSVSGTSGSETATFDNTVNTANIAIQSFNFNYGADTDQYIDDIYVTVSNIQINNANNMIHYKIVHQ